jgi:hypothetical protein
MAFRTPASRLLRQPRKNPSAFFCFVGLASARGAPLTSGPAAEIAVFGHRSSRGP